MPSPDRIWLSPLCDGFPRGEERTWSDFPDDCEECEEKAVEYIRADLVQTALKALADIQEYIDTAEGGLSVSHIYRLAQTGAANSDANHRNLEHRR